uniref:Capsid protein n=2 Tax=unclassified Solemoviridae TaxID=2600328 RepID=A0A7L9AY43_9VIRU|nr:capsid [Guangzhou sobemo-like virus]QOI91434.1 capsid [Guangzhou sobemo-like virus]QOI91438.1 capsid [Guangzhou sobemo-like virus]UBJ26033.1 capsid protein [Sichuan mosquito sobemo-like virus]BEJ26065.1 capsid protein [Wenzhou sobemo-like virus 4]
MSKQLKKQLNALTAQVAALKVATKQQPNSSAKKRKRNRKGKRSGGPQPGVSAEGKIVVQRAELLCEIKVAKNAAGAAYHEILQPTDSRMAWLYKLSKNFSQIVWHTAKLEYRPAVGAMKDGSLVVGVDWNPIADAPDKAKVQSMTPNFQVPVWQKKELTIPSSRLQSRKFYSTETDSTIPLIDRVPCEVLAYISCSKSSDDQYFGDIWVHYNVTLMGPT